MQTSISMRHASLERCFKAAKNVFQFVINQFQLILDTSTKPLMNHNYCTIAVIGLALFFSSCQKEKLSEDIMVNSTSMSSQSATAKAAFGSGIGSPSKLVNYGAFICPPSTGQGWLGFQQSVASQLGVTSLRGSTLVPGNGNPPMLLSGGYGVLFNFNSNNDAEDDGGPTPFVKDLTQYKIDLSNIIALCPVKPLVAVIENEESNRYYYSGSAWDYIKQLNAAIGVMHANGIKVANGGLTSGGLEYLVYQDFMSQGKEDSAKQFQKLTHVTPNSPTTQERGIFVDSLLRAYVQMDIDYVNFHWKGDSPDTEALQDVINYIRKRLNKPVISNELGQYDKDPNTLLAMVQLCTTYNFPFLTWYSPDEKHGKKATPLQYDNATLTNTGNAYQLFLAN